MRQEIKKLIEDFKGLACWSSLAGSGTGSIFTLGFGRKIPIKIPLTNPHLTIDQRNFDSEYSLMVWSSWSLSKEKIELLKNKTERMISPAHRAGETYSFSNFSTTRILVCDSNSSNDNDGQMVVGLRELIGKRIEEIMFNDTTLDLEIKFDSGYRLIVLSDGYDLYGDDADNYVLFFPGFTISVTTQLEVRKSLR